jgi:hypothetical protein
VAAGRVRDLALILDSTNMPRLTALKTAKAKGSFGVDEQGKSGLNLDCTRVTT